MIGLAIMVGSCIRIAEGTGTVRAITHQKDCGVWFYTVTVQDDETGEFSSFNIRTPDDVLTRV